VARKKIVNTLDAVASGLFERFMDRFRIEYDRTPHTTSPFAGEAYSLKLDADGTKTLINDVCSAFFVCNKIPHMSVNVICWEQEPKNTANLWSLWL
jgi:hypothetical protein